jgi:pilus assembly protein CpaC
MKPFSSLALRLGLVALVAAIGLFEGPSLASAAAKPKAAIQKQTVAPKDALKALSVLVDQGVPMTLDRPATSVFIANPDIADVQVMSPTEIMVFGKRTGETTLLATDASGAKLAYRRVSVSQDLGALRAALDAVLPHNKIRLDSVPNGIVLTGTASDPSEIDDARRLASRYIGKDKGEVINRIKVLGSNQIHIRVRFAEVTRDIDKKLGFDWETVGNAGGFNLGLAVGSTVIDSTANLLGRSRPSTSGSENDILSFSRKGKNYNVNGMIDALAEEGLVTILAEPNLTAMSGETASFLAGGEIPVPVPQTQNTITIEWKQYGISLAFTPTLIGGNRINMHVRPEVSQLSDAGSITLESISVPALSTRRADTTVELASGQSFAIGGLLNNNQSQTIDKYPFLGDIPVLGTLFRSTRFQNNQTELVIIITPYLVKPTEQEQLSLPTDGFIAPNDLDFVGNHKTASPSPEGRPMSGDPRAVVLQEPEAPTPAAAPVSMVTPAASQPLPAAPTPRREPTAKALPSAAKDEKPASNGFILE